MGTWGTGNFDSDGALDFVAELTNQLVGRIEQCFAEGRANLDEDGEDVIVPSVQILSILHEHCDAAPPEVEMVSTWKQRYLLIYDEQIDALDPQPGYKVERRRIIEETFDTLEKQARDFWSDASQ